MSNAPKTVLCIHDLPGFGRAGLSVIVPVLSALGAQAVAVPTAVLSTHTGGLGTPAKLSNPGYGPAALAHYQRLGLRFDCIYSGLDQSLGSFACCNITCDYLKFRIYCLDLADCF